jgi:flagellar motility protein MotE (MotC chaperone)
MGKIDPPRLLPTTIATLAALLMLKCGILLQAVVTHGGRSDSVMVAAANAASTERSPEAPAAAHAAPRPKPAADSPTPAAAQKPAADSAMAAAAQKPAAPSPASESPQPASETERALLQDLRQRRQELDALAASVATRESVMMAAEQKLATRMAELQALQKKLEGLDAAQKQKVEAGWQGLVKVYEAMKPKDAANIFNDLQMPVLLQVLDRMKDAKTAAVMAAMNPDRARDVTAELAQMRTGKDEAQSPPAAVAQVNSDRN